MQLTNKEKSYLQDAKQHEEMCIKKYGNYANQLQDQELKNLFNQIQQKEQEYLNTINQFLNQ